jgi:GNAT superfamily N-acetyltransferase
MNRIQVRTATSKDATTIAEYQVLMARETEGLELDPPTVARGVQAMFDDADKGTYYVAEEAGRLVGCLLITPEWSDWRNGWFWWIQSVYVVPEARRGGVFQALYRHVLGLARRSPDLRGLRLYVDKRNAAARKVYEALGMDGDHYRLYEWIKP